MSKYDVNIQELVGKTFRAVENLNNDELVFTTVDGQSYVFYHSQDCCESVWIDDICGELADLENSPLLLAEESSSHEDDEGNYESVTWTFYKFSTIKGSVTVRWCGTSNGYYSESVDLRLEE